MSSNRLLLTLFYISLNLPLAKLVMGHIYTLSILQLRQYRIILSADTASEVRQLPERCLSRKAGIVRCCPNNSAKPAHDDARIVPHDRYTLQLLFK